VSGPGVVGHFVLAPALHSEGPGVAFTTAIWASFAVLAVMRVESVDTAGMGVRVVGHMCYTLNNPAELSLQGELVTGRRFTLPMGGEYVALRPEVAADVMSEMLQTAFPGTKGGSVDLDALRVGGVVLVVVIVLSLLLVYVMI
jgi:hypothetical protein